MKCYLNGNNTGISSFISSQLLELQFFVAIINNGNGRVKKTHTNHASKKTPNRIAHLHCPCFFRVSCTCHQGSKYLNEKLVIEDSSPVNQQPIIKFLTKNRELRAG